MEHRLSSVQVPGNIKGGDGRDGTSDSHVNHLCPCSPLRKGVYRFWPLMTFLSQSALWSWVISVSMPW